MKQIIFAFLLLCAFSITDVFAQSKSPKITPEVAKAEEYFKNLTTAQARFLQTAPDGSQTRGTFYLSRPGKLRFQYDKPLADFVVADGLFIYFYDGKLKQQSNAPISQTLADFILRKNLKLRDDLKVTKISRGGGLLQMTVVQAASPASGSLTLGFKEEPTFELKKWRIKDATGSITEIELSDLKRNVKLSSSLFRFIDPNPRSLN
jgi:outer membrane lipoprotein-sorting protein